MEWINDKLVTCANWLKSNIQPVRLWICGAIGCPVCRGSTECLDKVVQKTKIKLRKKAKKKGK
jgi:hypothetical protein